MAMLYEKKSFNASLEKYDDAVCDGITDLGAEKEGVRTTKHPVNDYQEMLREIS